MEGLGHREDNALCPQDDVNCAPERTSKTIARDAIEPTLDSGDESQRFPTKTPRPTRDLHSFSFQDDSDGAVAAVGRTPCADRVRRNFVVAPCVSINAPNALHRGPNV